MATRTYPYTAFALTPGFQVKQVELVKPYRAFGGADYGDLTEAGKLYPTSELFPSPAVAIEIGRRRLEAQEAKLRKQQESIDKRRKALAKAEKETA